MTTPTSMAPRTGDETGFLIDTLSFHSTDTLSDHYHRRSAFSLLIYMYGTLAQVNGLHICKDSQDRRSQDTAYCAAQAE